MQLLDGFKALFTSRITRFLLLGIVAFSMIGGIGGQGDDFHRSSSGIFNVANAAETEKPASGVDAVDTTITTLVALHNLMIGILTFLITPLIMLAGWLLSPDWTFGDIFGLRPVFHNLWILISNVVYVIFAFILIFVAFANIFGGEHAKAYEMKTMLPKLVVGILMVPFSWFIVSATLSVANVLTASVIQLPYDMLKNTEKGQTMLDDPIIPKKIIYNQNVDYGKAFQENPENADGTNSKANGNFMTSDCGKDRSNCLSIAEFLTNGKGGAYNLLSVYAYGIFKIQDFTQITPEQMKGMRQVTDILKKLSFGLIFFVIFGILIIAIIYALFSRVVMLWLFAIFSPLFALNHVLGGSKSKSLEKLAKFDIQHFISLALVPVYVSAALAFGLMFLGAVMNGQSKGTDDGNPGVLTGESATITTKDDTTTFQFGEITLTTIGLITAQTKAGVNSALGGTGGFIGTVIVNVLALAILWMAVMAALGANEITEAAVKPIAEMGHSVGELMSKAPQYIPIPGTGGQSMASVGQGVKTSTSAMNTHITNKAGEIVKKFGFADAADQAKAYTEWKSAIASNNDFKGMADGLKAMQKTFETPVSALNDARYMDALKSMGSKLGIEEKDLNPKNIGDLTETMKKFDDKLKEKNVELLKENSGEITGPVVTSMFGKGTTGSSSGTTTTTHATVVLDGVSKYGIKNAGSSQEIKLKIDGNSKIINLQPATRLDHTNIVLDSGDKAQLTGLIGRKNESDAKKILEGIFDGTQIDINKLYEAIK